MDKTKQRKSWVLLRQNSKFNIIGQGHGNSKLLTPSGTLSNFYLQENMYIVSTNKLIIGLKKTI
jgi:hypothetical protein